MAKKYLTLEEAAHQLGMAPDELVRFRERGEIRGFADRGTWKFKSEDVEEFARSRDADSSPEVPILDDAPKPKVGATDSGIRRGGGSGRFNKTSDSDVRLLLDETLVPGSKDSDPEVVLSQLGTSDSDVRLVEDVGGLVDSGSDSDVKLISTSSTEMDLQDGGSSSDASDSDVQLVGTTSAEIAVPKGTGSSSGSGSSADASDSDVQLVAADSDSDVRLAKPADKGKPNGSRSDSDVRLVGTDDLATVGSESDIRLSSGSGSSVDIGGGSGSSSNKGMSGTSSIVLTDSGSDDSSTDESSVLLGDSGIALDTGSAMKVGAGSSADSGITLQSLADSGISLEKADSGISLAGPMDSGIALDADSGIALEKEDSGIALEGESGIRLADSGAKKDKKKDKGPKKKDGDRTAQLKLDEEEDSTQVEVPTLDDEDEGSYSLEGGKGDDKTNVVLFAEDDDEAAAPAAPARGKKGRPDDSFALQESGVEFAEAEDFSDDADLEVAEDVLTEEGDDMDEIDVFEPAEEDFDSTAQSGESHSEIAPAIALRTAAPVEAPWDGLTFAGLCVSSVFLSLAGVVMFDLVRTMWYWDQNVVVGQTLLDWVKGIF
jgi:excisionase family DNA binding protein